MKQFALITLLISIAVLAQAQVKVGQRVTDVQVGTLLNAPVKSTSLAALRGKVVLLEFWATWCSPCVEAMVHLKTLQKTYRGKLQIVTVSTEKEKRVKQFLTNQPSNLWFAIDTANIFGRIFPYHIIPQTVLIDKNGTVVAITEPQNITTKVIADVIAGKKINLPLKKDDMTSDPLNTYFAVDTSIKSRFIVQGEIKGAGSASKTYDFDPVFANRRISMMNLSLDVIYRIAYGNVPYGRTINLVPKENTAEYKKVYCMDIIVPKGKEHELLPTLQHQLESHWPLRANIEKQLKPVYVLVVADGNKIVRLKKSIAVKHETEGGLGSFSGTKIQLREIGEYLEEFGLVNKPVIDETGETNFYDINFNYMPEKKGDLRNALNNLGLKLVEADRDIGMLVLR